MEESGVMLSGSQACTICRVHSSPPSESVWRLQRCRYAGHEFGFFRIYFLKACISEFYELKFKLCSEVLLLVF